MLRVLIVSDVRVVQEGLNSLLAQRAGIDVVSAVDMLRAGDEIARLLPDVVLFDAVRPESVEFVKTLVASAPHSRIVAFGVLDDREIAVVYTVRETRRRIISARRASKDEREAYRNAYPKSPPSRQD